jgi:hypothetical protein
MIFNSIIRDLLKQAMFIKVNIVQFIKNNFIRYKGELNTNGNKSETE